MDITTFIASKRETLLIADHATYRAQLSRQILATRKRLGRTTPKREKFARKPLTAADVQQDVAFVHLQLLIAERAWAHALHIKNSHAEDEKGITGSARAQICSKLWKASKTAQELVDVLREVGGGEGDLLEARTYTAMLAGAEEFEKQAEGVQKEGGDERWNKCLKRWSEARVGYAALWEKDRKEVFREMLANTVDPTIRYAAYQARLSRTIAIEVVARRYFPKEDAEAVRLVEAADSFALKEKPKAESGEEKKADVLEVPDFVTWRGRRANIVDASIGQALASVSAAEAKLKTYLAEHPSASASQKAAAYDDILIASQDAADASKRATDELEKERVDEGDARMQDLRVTSLAVNYDLVSWRVGRNRILIGDNDGLTFEAQKQKKSQRTRKDGTELPEKDEGRGRRLARLRERVVLYDATIQSVESVKDLRGAMRDETFVRELDGKSAYFRALKCINISYSHALLDNHLNALALLKRAQDLITAHPSPSSTASTSTPPTLDIPSSESSNLKTHINNLLSRSHALVEMHKLSTNSAIAAQKNMTSAAPTVQNLNAYPTPGLHVDLNNLVSYPPRIQPVPVKPLFLDVAWNYIDYPGRGTAPAVAAVPQAVDGINGKMDVDEAEPVQEKKKGWFGFELDFTISKPSIRQNVPRIRLGAVTFYRAQRITSFKSAARLQLLHKYIIEVLLQARFNSRNTNLTTLADAFTSLDIYTPGRNSDRSLQRGQQHEALIKHLRALRTYESAHLDGAWILGDVRTGSNTPYGKRLRRLGVLGGKTIRTQSLAFHGSETSVSPDSEPCPYLSNMHINVPSVPGMVVFSPSHNPGAVRKGFRDPLIYRIQLPLPYMPLAVPVKSLIEAQERWRKAEASGTKYKVPQSEVAIDVWKAKAANPSVLLGNNEPVGRASDFLYKAIAHSRYEHRISVSFSTFSPMNGNATIRAKSSSKLNDEIQLKDFRSQGVELQWDLVTEIYKDGALVEIEIEQMGATVQESKRVSAFHPNRTHDFYVVFNPSDSFGFCLPAAKLSTDYWCDDQFIYIPANEIAEYRFVTTGTDWFADLFERIISPNLQEPTRKDCSEPQRPEHTIPDNAVPEEYATLGEVEHGISDTPTEEELSSYPWWKIERWNRCAAYKGYGVYIPLGNECDFANVVWMGYRWSVQEKVRYFATQQLPVCFHQGDVEPGTPLLLIRAIQASATADGFVTTISGRDLEDGGFPCLYYVDSWGYRMKHVPRSGALIPSEFIDRESLEKRREGLPDARRTTRVGSSDNIRTRERADYLVNVEQHLLAPCTLFQVREGDDFDDAIHGLFSAHTKDEKPLTWYGCEQEELTAKDNYIVSARDVWQKIADEWIPDGAIKIPVEAVKQPEEDDSDVGSSESIPAYHDGHSDDEDDGKFMYEDDGGEEGKDEGSEDTEDDESNAEDDIRDEDAGNIEGKGSNDVAEDDGSIQMERQTGTQAEAWWT